MKVFVTIFRLLFVCQKKPTSLDCFWCQKNSKNLHYRNLELFFIRDKWKCRTHTRAMSFFSSKIKLLFRFSVFFTEKIFNFENSFCHLFFDRPVKSKWMPPHNNWSIDLPIINTYAHITGWNYKIIFYYILKVSILSLSFHFIFCHVTSFWYSFFPKKKPNQNSKKKWWQKNA